MMDTVRTLCDIMSGPGEAPGAGVRNRRFIVRQPELEIMIQHNMVS